MSFNTWRHSRRRSGSTCSSGSTSSLSSGASLHETVPPARWCVTRLDLKVLRQEVLRSIQEGDIQVPADGSDDFDPSDETFGPSIYTVNEQYIKPVTSRAGIMSWALMRNPRGLDCDIFISHAWQEGIFEFLAKVRHSWSQHLRHAWCCMLANPQNLNIEALLESPRSSPFALALRASKLVLVVPNRHQSVYTRLWCAYEAYLAQEEGKPILIAKTSKKKHMLLAFAWLLLAAVLGLSIGILAKAMKWQLSYEVAWAACASGVVALSIQNNRPRFFLHLLFESLCFFELINWKAMRRSVSYLPMLPEEYHVIKGMLFWVMAATMPFLMEVDRINAIFITLEAQQLQQKYRGSIRFAECSQRTDAQNIGQEIGDRTHAVDFAIQVLLKAGMSSPAIRDIAQAGVDIEHAAYAKIASTVILLGPLDLLSVAHIAIDLSFLVGCWWLPILHTISFMLKMILLVVLCKSPPDERRFVLKVAGKCLALVGLVLVSMCIYAWSSWTTQPTFAWVPWLIMTNVILFLLVIFSLLGIKGTARLPFGHCLVQFFFARGIKAVTACCNRKRPQLPESDNDSETDTGGTGS